MEKSVYALKVYLYEAGQGKNLKAFCWNRSTTISRLVRQLLSDAGAFDVTPEVVKAFEVAGKRAARA